MAGLRICVQAAQRRFRTPRRRAVTGAVIVFLCV